MGHIDEFLSAQVTPQLVAGEQVAYAGLVRWPKKFNRLSVPEVYEDWLAVATNQRLFLFRTNPSGVLSITPKPLRLEDRVWWYQDLREVTTGKVEGLGSGLSFRLFPHEPLGPFEGESRRYDVVGEAAGCDGQANLREYFGPWLQQQVAAGAFPMDDARRAAVAAHQEQERAAQQARVEAKAARAKHVTESGRNLLLLAIAALLVTCAGLFMTLRAMEKADSYAEMAANNQHYAESAKDDAREHARQLDMAREARDTHGHHKTMTVVFGLMTLGALGGTVVLGTRYRRRRAQYLASAA